MERRDKRDKVTATNPAQETKAAGSQGSPESLYLCWYLRNHPLHFGRVGGEEPGQHDGFGSDIFPAWYPAYVGGSNGLAVFS